MLGRDRVDGRSAALGGRAREGEDARTPSVVGPYRIVDVLGKGGMGVVYRAVRCGEDRPVALKTVRIPRGSSVTGIRAEILALSRLHHPSVVRILTEGVEGGLPWYAMELLEGSTMRDYIGDLWRAPGPGGDRVGLTQAAGIGGAEPDATTRVIALARGDVTPSAPDAAPGAPRRQRIPVAAGRLREALTLMRRLCAPLAYLHGRGVVHRDLKPSNVFIRTGGEPVLVDFGLVSRFRGGLGREALEVGGLLVGTAAYMAPEQAMGLLVDARADLYGFGIMLYEVLTGGVPFSGGTTRELLQRQVSERPAPPSSLVDGIPERLDALVLRLLAKKPRDRFGYAEDVAAALAELGADPSPEIHGRAFLFRPDLCGREAALASLDQSIARLRRGAGGCVLVGGESGVGKTSLVARAARNATLAQLPVITGECLPIAIAGEAASVRGAALEPALPESVAGPTALDVTGAPLHPFHPLLQAIADRCREGGPEAVAALLGSRGKVLAAYAPALLDLPGVRDQPDPPDLPVEAAHQRVLHDLAETLSAYAAHAGALLLVLDDLQWADELSLSFLRSLPAEYFEAHQVLILGAYRSDEVGAHLRQLLLRPATGIIELGRLDERTVGVIVGDMLALARPPRPFVRFLAEQSEGNPFFVAEYLRAAVEEGLLRREEGTWRFVDRADRGCGAEGGALIQLAERASGADLGERGSDPSLQAEAASSFEALPLPRSLREIVGRRLMGLGEAARGLLEVAAVLGREVDAALLAEVDGGAPEAALEALKELAARQVLLPVEGGRHRFAHDKLREITYGQIPTTRCRAIHAAAAAALERQLTTSPLLALHYSELAHHWTAAEVWPKSIHYLEKAGEQALRDFSNREAIRFFRQAIALGARAAEPPAPLQLARWERSLVEAHQGLGEDALGRVHAERALRHCRRPVPTSATGRLLGCVVQIVIRLLQSYLPPREVTSPVKRALLLEAAYVSQRMLEPAFRDNDPLLGVYCGVRSLNLAERAPRSPPLARGYAFMSMLVGLTPLQRVARSWSARALRIADGIGSGSLTAYCLSRVGCYSISVARWEEAEAQLRRAADLARALGDRRQLDESLTLLGISFHASGRFEESVRIAEDELASGAARGDLQTQGWARSRMAQSLARVGRAAEALAVLEASRGWIEHSAGDTEALWAEAAAALAHLGAGDPEGAWRAADRALARMKKRPPVQFYLGAPCAEVAEVYLALREQAGGGPGAPALTDAARSAVAILTRFARIVQFIRPAALRARGTQAWLDREPALAARTWRKALAEAARLGMPHEEGRTHLEIGLREGPVEARAHLTRAVELLGPGSDAADVLRAREALAALPR